VNFDELHDILSQVKNHNPYRTHRIKFHLVLVVTKNTFEHNVDFKVPTTEIAESKETFYKLK